MKGRVIGIWSENDPYNSRNERNAINTHADDYNCAGFALRTFSWYCPLPQTTYDRLEELFEEGFDFETIENMMTNEMVDTMLSDFPNELRVVEYGQPIKSDEELIAFRFGLNYDSDFDFDFMGPWDCDVDFHYQVLRDGRWQEKNGDGEIHDCDEPDPNIAWSSGWLVYGGPLVFLARKVN